MSLGPVPAIKRAPARTGMEIDDIELIELNEAFAAQAIGCMLELGLDIEKPNRQGSAIAMGHPVGCTGARQMVAAISQIRRGNFTSGLIGMCIGGGMGRTIVVNSLVKSKICEKMSRSRI